ncbi:MAG: ImmA/IrrE family metallo-endopeptidase [Deltaproteobacteria bacterium]|nr:ImmA/IrrE family metallo-endopeptidase [Deltaproteobacteria bacterium]
MPLTEDLITSLEQEIPGYNRRPLDVEDLERLCQEEGVVLVVHPFPGEGLYFEHRGVPVVTVNRRLEPNHAAFVGFHEFFHYRFHPGTIHTYSSTPFWLNKIEFQASVLASLAVLPTPWLVQALARQEPLNEVFNLPEYIVDFRFRVHQEYQNLLEDRKDF